MNLNEQLRQAYEAGRQQALNEQVMPNPYMPTSTPDMKGLMNTQRKGATGGGDDFAQRLGELLAAFGTNNPEYDFNGDGIVDGADLGILLGQGGGTAG